MFDVCLERESIPLLAYLIDFVVPFFAILLVILACSSQVLNY